MTAALSNATLTALGLAAAGAVFVVVTKQSSWRGALAGLVVACLCALGLGAGALAPLAVFVLGGGALTRLGVARKRAMGVLEANEGKRDASHVVAKLALPALVAAVAGVAGLGRELAPAYVTALAGAFADTAGTEVGPLGTGSAYGLRGGRVVKLDHGSPGGVSALGLVGAAVGAIAVAVTAAACRLTPGVTLAALIAAGGFAAALLESLIAPTAAGKALGHFGRNAFVSATATILGLALGLSNMGNP